MSPLIHDPLDTVRCCLRQHPHPECFNLRWRCPTCGRAWKVLNGGDGWGWYPVWGLSKWLLRRQLRKEGR